MKHVFISKEVYDNLIASNNELKKLNQELNKENKALYDESKHIRSMLRLYEAAFNNGIEVNFPNTDPDDERTSDAGIDFDDF